MTVGVTDNPVVVSGLFVVENSKGELLTLYIVKHTAYKLSKPYEIKEGRRLSGGRVEMSSRGFFKTMLDAKDKLLELKTTAGREWLEH